MTPERLQLLQTQLSAVNPSSLTGWLADLHECLDHIAALEERLRQAEVDNERHLETQAQIFGDKIDALEERLRQAEERTAAAEKTYVIQREYEEVNTILEAKVEMYEKRIASLEADIHAAQLDCDAYEKKIEGKDEQITSLEAELREGKDYLGRLLTTQYPDVHVLEDLPGIATQIDNAFAYPLKAKDEQIRWLREILSMLLSDYKATRNQMNWCTDTNVIREAEEALAPTEEEKR